MPDPDETLAAIDNVITWHGSRDAMVWTAEPPEPPKPPAPVVLADPEAMRRAFAEMGAALNAFTEQMRSARRRWAGLLIEAYERGEVEPDPDPCNCPCGCRHPGRMGICTSQAAGAVRYHSPTVGVVDVSMCAPCLEFEGGRS